MTHQNCVRVWSTFAVFLSTSAVLLSTLACCANQLKAQEKAESTTAKPVETISKADAIAVGVDQLLKIQNEDGAWPYEGVYRVKRHIPVGYRIGGTAIVCQALLYATKPDNIAANSAIAKGVERILSELEHPLMKPSQEDRYDVRVWGHIYALDLFGRLKQSTRFPEICKRTNPWIPTLTETLLSEELPTGGWNYANRRAHAGFVTAPAVQALLWARQTGQQIPGEVWKRSAEAMLRSRNDDAAFAYSGDERKSRPAKLPGSIARSANCEATLSMLGLQRDNAIKFALDAFHEHWDELEKRRKQTGTHKPPYGIAPYYFYYGHRYAAFAIEELPLDKRAAEHERLFEMILRTRDSDGTWNDRVFARSRAYGTAMTVLALLEDRVPPPAGLSDFEMNPKNGEVVLNPVIVQIDPKLITPKLTVEISSDGNVKIGDQTVALDSLETWFQENPIINPPDCVIISADGETKTGDVEKLKTILRTQIGETSLYVGIKE
jgi:hypothetical protein